MAVRVERKGPLFTVLLSRPERRNAVDGETAAALAEAFREFDSDADAKVAVLHGEGGVFCAGADLKAQVVRVLYDGLRDGIPRCYAALRGMAEAAGTPAGLGKDIAKKLKRFSAVAPRA